MTEEWVEQCGRLVDTFGLEHKPVAVTFTNENVEGVDSRKASLCRALKLASEGRSFVIDRMNSACPGGSWHCGLTQPVSGEAWRGLQKFLTCGEKLTSTIVTFQRMTNLTAPPPTGLSDRIVLWPMEEALLRPDLVLFLCNPEQACRLLTLDHFWDGIPPKLEIAGSLCHSAIAYPITTGNTNVTFGDWTARRMQKFAVNVVFVTVPYERMNNLVLAIDKCSAGTAEIEIPPEMRRSWQESE